MPVFRLTYHRQGGDSALNEGVQGLDVYDCEVCGTLVALHRKAEHEARLHANIPRGV